MEGILLHTVEIAGENFTIFTIKNNPGKFVPLCLSASLSSEQNLKYTNYTDIFILYRLKVYGWKKLQPLAYLNYHTETVNSLDFSDEFPNWGQLMAAGSKDSRISLWSIYNDRKR